MRVLLGLLLVVGSGLWAQEARFEISQAETEARFLIEEELFGNPKLVEGVTRSLDGAIIIANDAVDWLRLTPFRLDARTFVTDSAARNRAIEGRILQAHREPNRYIVFTPHGVSGLPPTHETTTLDVDIEGELTIRQISRRVRFATRLDLTNPRRISGAASATVDRSDFDLRIPWVPMVANVAQRVRLEIDFVAVPAP